MRNYSTKQIFTLFAATLCILVLALAGSAAAKSVYLSADHHTKKFDAWSIEADGTVTKQATYSLNYATDPAGIGIDVMTGSGNDPLMFVSTEGIGGIEVINPVTLQYHGIAPGPVNMGGVDVDDENNILFAIQRGTSAYGGSGTSNLYIYTYNNDGTGIAQLANITLPNHGYGMSLAFDDLRDVLWVGDIQFNMVRAYDVNVSDWNNIAEIASLSFSVSHPPIDVAVDMARNLVYTVAGWAGSNLITKYDVATSTETTANIGHGGMGVAVDEITGYVYMTGGGSSGTASGDNLEVWDCSTSPFTRLQATPDIGNPAGIAIANVSYNPLNLAKNDNIQATGVSIGSKFTYNITFDSPSSNLTGVIITDTLPVELDFVSANESGMYDSATHTVVWDIGAISADDTIPTFTLEVQVNSNATPGSTIHNYCKLDGDQIPPTTVIEGEGGEEPGTPINLCNPPTDVYADNSEAFGLFEGIVYNVNTEDVTTTYIDLQATDLIDLPLLGKEGVQFWVSIDVSYDPGYITVEPNLDDFVGGTFAAIKLIPPGSHASFKGSFCQPGTVTFELNPCFEGYAITLTLLDVIIGSGQIIEIIDPSNCIHLIDELNDIPFFASASIYISRAIGEALDKNRGKAFKELARAGRDLIKLALDNTQREQLCEVLIDFGFNIGAEALFKYLTRAPARVFKIFGDVIVLAIQTDLGTSGLPKVKLVAN